MSSILTRRVGTKPFGRISTQRTSLWCFTLLTWTTTRPSQRRHVPGVGARATSHGNENPVALGIFFMDNANARRWVLKSADQRCLSGLIQSSSQSNRKAGATSPAASSSFSHTFGENQITPSSTEPVQAGLPYIRTALDTGPPRPLYTSQRSRLRQKNRGINATRHHPSVHFAAAWSSPLGTEPNGDNRWACVGPCEGGNPRGFDSRHQPRHEHPVRCADNSAGLFTIVNLPPGSYRIEVSKPGFRTIVNPGVVLHVQDVVALNFDMPVGSNLGKHHGHRRCTAVNTESSTVARSSTETLSRACL